ncbi:sensor histidine kinase [Argonema antarcticum]|uniref:sensor histidine kinase n=1 Tax=Argonema antarcticum TaxID=2942763 RepID=UPI0020121CF2|nr:ATP-binding protein [Argonema antarcticum]MCL1469795.1 GHKL domain-containing protein [Argonema antarcticum A004/B2]
MSIRQALALTPASKNRGKILSLYWCKQLFSRLGIRQKIAYGYALVIGIALLGATTGKLLENYYQDQAKKQLAESQKIISLLNNLEAAVLKAHTQTPNLIPLLTEPVRLELEYSRFLEYIEAVNRVLYQTKSFLESSNSPDRDSLKQANDSKELKRSLQAYIDSIKDYSQRLETISKEFKPSTLKPEKVQSVLLANISYKSSKVDLEINKLSQEMSNIVAEIQEKEAQKTLQYLDKASAVGNLILIISLLSAVAIAAALAIYTSRVIAYPIEVTTKIARRVTKESNFTLQAPVLTEDEVGLLTTSLNELIQRVAEYTQELQQAQTQLIQTEKMSSLGQMIAGIAHEINNPVSFIYGNVEHSKNYVEELLGLVDLYQQKYPNPDEEIVERIDDIELEFLAEDLPKTLNSMKIGADRIRQLVLSLRNFSRLDEAEVKNVDLHEGIDSTLLILNNRLKDNIKVIKQYGNLPLVECHPAQLNQVFMNILNNAIDALSEQAEQSNKQIAIETEQIPPDKVQVRIRDNGSGIAPEVQNKIFDPFFTTKKVGKGTGLGLSISYQILEKHSGEIRCNSVIGEETEFIIELPVKQPLSS